MKRRKKYRVLRKRLRRYKLITITKKVMQCERPYVLFGQQIKILRASNNFTQQNLADKLGYARASIANIELGRQRVLLSDLFDFARVLKVNPKHLFEAVAK